MVVERVAAVYHAVAKREKAYPVLSLDSTGVGAPVADLLVDHDTSVTAVYFVVGEHLSVGDGERRLGKAYMVSRLQSLLQTERLHLPDTSEARHLARELLDFEIRVDEHANDLYGAFKVGSHDDLVTALGLAVHQRPAVVRFY
jgi:hypothetical protein